MAKYDMTKQALLMGLYTVSELTKLKDVTLDVYLSNGDIDQKQYDELMSMVIVALGA